MYPALIHPSSHVTLKAYCITQRINSIPAAPAKSVVLKPPLYVPTNDGSNGGTLHGSISAIVVNGVNDFLGVGIHAPASSHTLIAGASSVASTETHQLGVMLHIRALDLPSSSVYVGDTMAGGVVTSMPALGPVTISMSSTSSAPRGVVPQSSEFKECSVSGIAPSAESVQVTASESQPPAAQITSILPSTSSTLRAAAESRGLLVGAAVDSNEFGFPSPLVNEPLYGATLAKQYNILEPEAAMVWLALRPDQNSYDFKPGDTLVAFAQANQMKVRGHTLVWNAANPQWLIDYAATASPTQMAGLLKEHIQTVISHYRGKVFAWNVVNEAISDTAGASGTEMKASIWYNQPGIGLGGTGYIEQAFRWAHEADPDALLFYNDANIYGPSPRFTALLNMLNDFKVKGVPINGVGLQMHVDTSGTPDSAGLAAAIEQLSQLGLQVHITEMDVALPVSAAGVASPSALQAQAETYQRIVSVCLQNAACTAIQTWGFSDKHSWVPAYMPGQGAALPFDLNYQPKPAFNSILKTLIDTPLPDQNRTNQVSHPKQANATTCLRER